MLQGISTGMSECMWRFSAVMVSWVWENTGNWTCLCVMNKFQLSSANHVITVLFSFFILFLPSHLQAPYPVPWWSQAESTNHISFRSSTITTFNPDGITRRKIDSFISHHFLYLLRSTRITSLLIEVIQLVVGWTAAPRPAPETWMSMSDWLSCTSLSNWWSVGVSFGHFSLNYFVFERQI